MQNFEDLVADFEFIDDWEERYKYVIELGRQLPAYPEEFRDSRHKVQGCVSQVWLKTTYVDGPNGREIEFLGDSDALIVSGLIAILTRLLSKTPAHKIIDLDVDAQLTRLGLFEHLTPQRSNGLRSMISRIKQEAAKALVNP